jgi:DNA repair protein RadC
MNTGGGMARSFSSIPEWPEQERPRERLLRHGPEALSDAELLAILIRTGAKGTTAVDLARRLLKEFDSIHKLSSASLSELQRQGRGTTLGIARGASIVAAFELGRRAASRRTERRLKIQTPQDIAQEFIPRLQGLKKEQFWVALLDSANHLLRDERVSDGILNSSLVHPREVFKPAIVEPAAAIILIHNHPSGNPEPSGEDLQVTRQLVETGKIIGIPVHDHIIIAGNSYASFAERGIL